MKDSKNILVLLCAGVLFLFCACNSSDGEGTPEAPNVRTEMGEFDLTTLRPDINQNQVLFQATLNTEDNSIDYGFMWYILPGRSEQPTVHKVPVGSGAHTGTFSIPMTDLPKGQVLVVCSYVERSPGGPGYEQIGDELNFDWD